MNTAISFESPEYCKVHDESTELYISLLPSVQKLDEEEHTNKLFLFTPQFGKT